MYRARRTRTIRPPDSGRQPPPSASLVPSSGWMTQGDCSTLLSRPSFGQSWPPAPAAQGCTTCAPKPARRRLTCYRNWGGRRVLAVEVKASASVDTQSARHLIWLRDELGDRFIHGLVLHAGPRLFELTEQITAVPISALWS